MSFSRRDFLKTAAANATPEAKVERMCIGRSIIRELSVSRHGHLPRAHFAHAHMTAVSRPGGVAACAQD